MTTQRQPKTFTHKKIQENLDERDKFLETQYLPRVNCEDIENMNRPKTSKEIESITKKLLTKKAVDLMASFIMSTKHLKD